MKEHMLLWSELNHEQLKHLEYIGVDERYYYEWYFTDFQIQIKSILIKFLSIITTLHIYKNKIFHFISLRCEAICYRYY